MTASISGPEAEEACCTVKALVDLVGFHRHIWQHIGRECASCGRWGAHSCRCGSWTVQIHQITGVWTRWMTP
jgi:hypothetical protein